MNNFIFLGGDLRFIYAASKLNKTHDCFVYGFDMIHDDTRVETGVPLLRQIRRCNNVVLPLPVSVNCDYITAPYSSEEMPFSSIVKAIEPGGTVYCGKECPALREFCEKRDLTLIDYFEREELAVMNAVSTSEGAIEIIMREQATTIMGMNILITGYGRISKVLSRYLHSLGANVTVCARKFSDLAWARIMGCSAVLLSEIDDLLSSFDTVVNTVPAQIFDREMLLKLKSDCLIVDLASKTGISDMELAKSSGVKVIWALSLPGKVAPITAGHIIADTILNIIAENEKGGEL
ncbi:MAG: dipicolinate synthase subunit DpsA [Oscillospiraceae bacterium]|nr:dipicolinate synthase subunit DpsA [Oscillospiraceae bacterium]